VARPVPILLLFYDSSLHWSASKLMTGLIIKSYKSLNGVFKWKFEHIWLVSLMIESVSKRSKCWRGANVARKSDAAKYKIRDKVGFEDFWFLESC
jgi:hypothetical protein